MNDRETFAQNSFEKQGSGFHYSYDSPKNTLSIASLERQKIFARLKFDYTLTKNPLAYVSALDKTNQIKALMYSNNETLNLAETMDFEKISAILNITAQISRYTYNLIQEDYEGFSALFCNDFKLKTLKLKKFPAHTQNKSFYAARLQTQHNNAISAHGCSLPVITEALSDRTLRELIVMEFGHDFCNSAQNLLNASSKLSIISRVLDTNYTPAKRLKNALASEKPDQTVETHKN